MKLILSRQKYWLLKSMIWILYFVYVIIAFLTIQNYDLKLGILLCGLIIELSLISFLNNWYKLRTPKLLDWFRLGTFLTLILNFLGIAFSLDSADGILVNNTVFVSSANALKTLFVILIGLLGLRFSDICIKFFPFKIKPSKQKNYTIQRINLFYVMSLVLSIIQITLMLSGFTGYGSNISYNTSQYSFLLQIIMLFAPFHLVFFAILKFFFKKGGTTFNSIFIFFFIGQLLLGFLSGMKEEMITPIILITVPYIFSGGKISRSIILIFTFSILILYPINNNYRDYLNTTKLDKQDALGLAIVSTFSGSSSEIIVSGSESYFARLSLFPMAMYSVDIEQSWNEYKYLNRYLLLPITWITPRFLFPQKPKSDTGSKLYETITGNNFNSTTPSTFGWAYLEGGYIPAFISFLIFGLIISIIQTKLNLNSLFWIIIYSIFLSNLLKIESDIYFQISEIFQTLLITYLLYIIFINEKKYLKY